MWLISFLKKVILFVFSIFMEFMIRCKYPSSLVRAFLSLHVYI